MGLFGSAKSKYQSNMTEEAIYGIVAEEVTQGKYSQGLYAKALCDVGGDEQKARARYIKLRVEALKTQSAAFVEFADEVVQASRVVEFRNPIPADDVGNPFMLRHKVFMFVCTMVGVWLGFKIGYDSGLLRQLEAAAMFGGTSFVISLLGMWILKS